MKNKKLYVFALVLFFVFVCAFSYDKGENLEENDYIMTMYFDVAKDSIHSIYEAPVLKKDSAQSVLYGEQKLVEYDLEHFQDFSKFYKDNTSKNADFGHLKVLLIGEELLKNEEKFSLFIKFLKEQRDFAENVLVAVDTSGGEILQAKEESVGYYLENLFSKRFESRPQMSPTVGKLLSAAYNKNQVVYIPAVSADKKVEGEWAIACDKPVKYIDEDEAKWFMIANCIDCNCELYFKDIYEGEVEEKDNFSLDVNSVKRQIEFTQTQDKVYANMSFTIKGTAKDYCGDIIDDAAQRYDKEEIFAIALSDKFQQLSESSKGADFFNTYYELSNKNRGIWKKYRNSYEDYVKSYILSVKVSVDFVD